MKELIQVSVVNGKPSVTSLQVAAAFGKEHFHVMRDIRAIIEDGDEFGESNFGFSSYRSEQNKEMPMYVMSKDGFVLLVMGYTGPEAMQVKKAYIARFNEMEEQLRHEKTMLPSDYIEALRALADSEEAKQRALEDKRRALETVKKQKPMVELAELRIDKKGCFSLTDVTKTLGLKRGQITKWARGLGYIHQSLNEVNKKGEKLFKVYSSDGQHNQIGITEAGLQEIENAFCNER